MTWFSSLEMSSIPMEVPISSTSANSFSLSSTSVCSCLNQSFVEPSWLRFQYSSASLQTLRKRGENWPARPPAWSPCHQAGVGEQCSSLSFCSSSVSTMVCSWRYQLLQLAKICCCKRAADSGSGEWTFLGLCPLLKCSVRTPAATTGCWILCACLLHEQCAQIWRGLACNCWLGPTAVRNGECAREMPGECSGVPLSCRNHPPSMRSRALYVFASTLLRGLPTSSGDSTFSAFWSPNSILKYKWKFKWNNPKVTTGAKKFSYHKQIVHQWQWSTATNFWPYNTVKVHFTFLLINWMRTWVNQVNLFGLHHLKSWIKNSISSLWITQKQQGWYVHYAINNTIRYEMLF